MQRLPTHGTILETCQSRSHDSHLLARGALP
jgi:hypothetical protein